VRAAAKAAVSMADTTPTEVIGPPLPPEPDPLDLPRTVVARRGGADRVFRGLLRGGGLTVFAITGLIAAFLIYRALSSFRIAGWSFFTTQTWLVGRGRFGVGSLLVNGIIIALIALIVAVPTAIVTALFISEYAPAWLRRPLISLVDLMAAIPSVIYALWGVFFLTPEAIGFCRWLADHLGPYFPPFRFAGTELASQFTGSPLIVGLVVALMVIPIVTSICREVFTQAPQGEREAAYALGASRWAMIRTVVLPYGRGGMIGATMLGFGRAMGETIVVTLVGNLVFSINWHALHLGSTSIAAIIATYYKEATPQMISALMAAGIVLFAFTLVVNALAGIIVTRSRSGAQTAD
jgi:phosphate transport system permease protein